MSRVFLTSDFTTVSKPPWSSFVCTCEWFWTPPQNSCDALKRMVMNQVPYIFLSKNLLIKEHTIHGFLNCIDHGFFWENKEEKQKAFWPNICISILGWDLLLFQIWPGGNKTNGKSQPKNKKIIIIITRDDIFADLKTLNEEEGFHYLWHHHSIQKVETKQKTINARTANLLDCIYCLHSIT